MKLIALFFITAFVINSAAFAQSKDEQLVAQAVEKLRKAMIEPDKATLDGLTADKLSYGHSTGKLEDKTAFVEALVSGQSDFQTINLTDQTITVVNETALVRHLLTGETITKGVVGPVKLAVLLVYVKEKSAWKLLARQAVKQ